MPGAPGEGCPEPKVPADMDGRRGKATDSAMGVTVTAISDHVRVTEGKRPTAGGYRSVTRGNACTERMGPCGRKQTRDVSDGAETFGFSQAGLTCSNVTSTIAKRAEAFILGSGRARSNREWS